MTDLHRAQYGADTARIDSSERNGYADVLVAQSFGVDDLGPLRATCLFALEHAGLTHLRALMLVWAINEGLLNAIQYGGGHGRLVVLAHPTAIVVEITDSGPVTPNVVPAGPDELESDGGQGLWAARRMVDHATLTAGSEGTTLRLEVAREA